MKDATSLESVGWQMFAPDQEILRWVKQTLPVAQGITTDPKNIADWLRCGGTWFAGVNILPNDRDGALQGGPSLCGEVIEFLHRTHGPVQWDKAQISVIYPGYPKPMDGECASAFRFRRDRDAAHIDGVLPIGPDRRRHLNEPHGFVLGIALNETSIGASPMVVWEGSHTIMRAAFRKVLRRVDPKDWPGIDLTDTYHAARRQCLETCKRVVIHAKPGETYLIHRLALHGVAPWSATAKAAINPKTKSPASEGRMIAYFRPELSDISRWLG